MSTATATIATTETTETTETYKTNVTGNITAYEKQAGPYFRQYEMPAHVGPRVAPVIMAESLKAILADSAIGRELLTMTSSPFSGTTREARTLKMHKIGTHFARRDKTVTYCPTGKTQTINPDGTWVRKGRQSSKPGRLANKILSDLIDSTDIEKFADSFKEHVVEFITGRTIAEVYVDWNAPSSCMTREGCYEWFDIYCNSPETVSMAIIRKGSKNENAIIARAICYVTTTGDKIYTTCYGISALKSWLESNGYRKWDRQDKVAVKNDHEMQPYLDGLSHFDGQYINYSSGTEYNSTNGGQDHVNCEDCGCSHHEEESHYIHERSICSDCACDYVYFGCAGYAHQDECSDASDYTECCGQYVLTTDSQDVEDVDITGSDDTYLSHDGDLYTYDAFVEAGYSQGDDGDWYDDNDTVDMVVSDCGNYIADVYAVND